MTSISGTYFNGQIKLDRQIKTKKPLKVVVSFEEFDNNRNLKLSDFSFLETQEILKDCKSSFTNEVIKERRKAV